MTPEQYRQLLSRSNGNGVGNKNPTLKGPFRQPNFYNHNTPYRILPESTILPNEANDLSQRRRLSSSG